MYNRIRLGGSNMSGEVFRRKETKYILTKESYNILLEALKDVAKEQHIKYIATGHYATKKSGTIQPGVNQVFDESDKLSLLTSDDIKKLLLPIGELDYQEVTKIAEANNINLTNTKQTPEEKIGANNIPKKD